VTIYLSNRDIRPTGVEPAEFIDVERMPDDDTTAAPPAHARTATAREESNSRDDGPS
jgi:hypothetical protein